MQADLQALQGLWRVVSDVSRGRPVTSGTTHFQFDGARVKEIDPFFVDGGTWAELELGPRFRPKRYTMTYTFATRGGGTRKQVHRGLYELTGDRLRVCWALTGDEYPTELSDKTQHVVTLTRYTGPPLVFKQASGKEPVTDRVLGKLEWDDSLNWWSGEVRFKPGLVVEAHIDPGARGDAAAIERAADFVRWLRRNDSAARRCAAEWLLETYNAFWNETGTDVAGRTFAARLTLDVISVRGSGAADLYYADGGLFRGHSITLRVNEKHVFERAQLSG